MEQCGTLHKTCYTEVTKQTKTMDSEDDRLSDLPDYFLCLHILSKLSLKDAIRCSVLSQRWRDLYTKLPCLKFSRLFFKSFEKKREDTLTQLQATITQILNSHSAPLESLHLQIQSLPIYNSIPSLPDLKCCTRKNIRKWTHIAGRKKVKQITLSDGIVCSCGLHPFNLPSSLFSCKSLTFLCLKNFAFTHIPNCFGGFASLLTCNLSDMTLKDGIVEQLIAGCPLLETLTLSCCTGLSNLIICSPNLICFSLEFSEVPPSMSLSCPRLIEFRVEKAPTVSDCDFPKEKKNNLSMSLELDLPSCEHLGMECKLLEGICLSSIKHLRKLTLFDIVPGQGQPFITILSRFLDIEELCIDTDCFQDTAEGEVARTLSLPLEKLKKVRIEVSGFGEKEIALVGCLLRSASSLQTMMLTLPKCLHEIDDRNFANQVLDLKRSSVEASLVIKEKSIMFCPCEYQPRAFAMAMDQYFRIP